MMAVKGASCMAQFYHHHNAGGSPNLQELMQKTEKYIWQEVVMLVE